MHVLEQHDRPFPYLLAEDCVPGDLAGALLDWFEGDAPWRLAATDFYEQYEFAPLDTPLPPLLGSLLSQSWLDRCRKTVEHAFGKPLETPGTLVAHKLVPGQRIGIHNDFLPDGETHRLTIQLNRGLSDEDGGLFMLFNSFDASDIHRILRPVSGSGVAFAIGPHSHHAVSTIHGGERFTLVFSYHVAADRLLG